MASERGIIEVIGDALYAYAEGLGLDPGMIRAYGAAGPIRDALQSAGLLVTPELTADREAVRAAMERAAELLDKNDRAMRQAALVLNALRAEAEQMTALAQAVRRWRHRRLDSDAIHAVLAAVDALDATTGAGT